MSRTLFPHTLGYISSSSPSPSISIQTNGFISSRYIFKSTSAGLFSKLVLSNPIPSKGKLLTEISSPVFLPCLVNFKSPLAIAYPHSPKKISTHPKA